jgi:lipopolysaccharide export LptBFGC system permease protein LptF
MEVKSSLSEEIKQNYISFIKLVSIILVIVGVIAILYLIFSANLAGYQHLKNTSTQMEIIPMGSEWEERIIIEDKEQINIIISLIENSTPDNNTTLNCNIERHRENGGENFVQLIIRRNLAKDDLSWRVCSENKETYIVPLLNGGSLAEEYKTDIELMSMLKEIIKENK